MCEVAARRVRPNPHSLSRYAGAAVRTESLEHDPEKACLGLDPRVDTRFPALREARSADEAKVGKDHAQTKCWSRVLIRSDRALAPRTVSFTEPVAVGFTKTGIRTRGRLDIGQRFVVHASVRRPASCRGDSSA